MKFMGSKSRHVKEILPIILAGRKRNQFYVEPFAGGFNVIEHVTGNRIACDIHPQLISLFNAVVNRRWIPPLNVTELMYQDVRLHPDHFPPELVGFIGFGCSYSGKYYGGYARGDNRNYCAESARNILSQVAGLSGTIMHCLSYDKLILPPQSLVYCDPPYAGTTGYKHSFDHVKFWQWVRCAVASGHTVYVSEYSAPDDFECVWSKRVNNTLMQDTGSKQGVERLFRMKK